MASSGSAWNAGGTWEEKDVTSWAKTELQSRLDNLAAPQGLRVKAVKDLKGEAHIAVIRGTRRSVVSETGGGGSKRCR